MLGYHTEALRRDPVTNFSISHLQPSSRFGLALWRYVWGPLSLLLAFGPLVFLNLLQFPSLALLPFSKPAYRQYNRACAFAVWGWWAWGVQRLVGLNIDFEGDEVPERENALVISNHQGMGDIIILLCLGLRKKRISDIKWMAKDVLKYVPGIGWGMQFLGCVFLKRRWAQDEAAIAASFAKYKRDNTPLWFVIFPEGTRFAEKKRQASGEYARANRLEPYEHVLVPRSKGFAAAVAGLREHVDAVYSITINYPGGAPSLAELIRGDVRHVRCHVRRVPMADVPRKAETLRQWLLDDFRKKDKYLGRQDYALHP